MASHHLTSPTHLLHTRHATRESLASYAAHPTHVAAVQGHVLPNALDITAVNWVNAVPLTSPTTLGSFVRLTLAKAKEGVEVGQLVEKLAVATQTVGDAEVSSGRKMRTFPPRARSTSSVLR
jgi:peroxin-10